MHIVKIKQMKEAAASREREMKYSAEGPLGGPLLPMMMMDRRAAVCC